MELIALTAFLSLANIFGVQAATSQMPQFADQQYPQAYVEKTEIAQNENAQPQSLLEAVVKFKKEKGWI